MNTTGTLTAAGVARPESGDLGEDPVSELIAGTCKGESRVRVEALEAAAPRGAADPDRQLGPQPPLLGARRLQAQLQITIVLGALGPALDPAGRLQARHRCDQMRAGQPERRRKRIAVLVVRRLLRHGRPAERTADSYATEGTRGTTQLTLDDGAIIHRRRRYYPGA